MSDLKREWDEIEDEYQRHPEKFYNTSKPRVYGSHPLNMDLGQATDEQLKVVLELMELRDKKHKRWSWRF